MLMGFGYDGQIKTQCQAKRTFDKSEKTFYKFNKNLRIFLMPFCKGQFKDIGTFFMRKCKANSH